MRRLVSHAALKRKKRPLLENANKINLSLVLLKVCHWGLSVSSDTQNEPQPPYKYQVSKFDMTHNLHEFVPHSISV